MFAPLILEKRGVVCVIMISHRGISVVSHSFCKIPARSVQESVAEAEILICPSREY